MTYADDSKPKTHIIISNTNFPNSTLPFPKAINYSCLFFDFTTTCIIPSSCLCCFLCRFLLQCFCIPFPSLFRGQPIILRVLRLSTSSSLSPFTISIPLVAAFASVKSKLQHIPHHNNNNNPNTP